MEELSFVPSAVSEPRWAVHMCDKKCTANGFKFLEIAAIVAEEGGAAHTINLCKRCYNEGRLKQGDEHVAASNWKELVEQKACRGKLWAAFGTEQFVRKMWERFTLKKGWTRSVLADVENANQYGTGGDWQQETSHNEEVELVWHSSDLRFEGILIRRAYDAGKSGDWEYVWKFSWEMARPANGQGRR